LQLVRAGNGFATVLGLADHVEPVLHQQPRERGTGQRVVVYEQDAFSHRHQTSYRQAWICRQE
jgi:hypothetical protein